MSNLHKIVGVVMNSPHDLFEAFKVLVPNAVPPYWTYFTDDDLMYIENGHNDGRCQCGCQEREQEEREDEIRAEMNIINWDNKKRHIFETFDNNTHGLHLYSWPETSVHREKKWIIGNELINGTNNHFRDQARVLKYFGEIQTIDM